MWISARKYEALVKRIEQLECSRTSDMRFLWNFEVYSDEDQKRFDDAARMSPYGMVQLPPGQRYSVKDVVEKLMAHCGLRLKYTPGSSANLSLEKKSASHD